MSKLLKIIRFTISPIGDIAEELLMPLSGKEMLKKYLKKGWIILRQRGSHVIVGKDDLRETILMHKELKKNLEQSLKKIG